MKPHQCSRCMKTFKHNRDAAMHIRDAHGGDGEVTPTGARRYDPAIEAQEEEDAVVREDDQQGS